MTQVSNENFLIKMLSHKIFFIEANINQLNLEHVVSINFELIQPQNGQLFPSVFKLNAKCPTLKIAINYTLTSVFEIHNNFPKASLLVKNGNRIEETNFKTNIVIEKFFF